MKKIKLLITVLCYLSLDCVYGSSFTAGVIKWTNNDVSEITDLIQEAGRKNVDVLVLPPDVADSENNYDKAVRNLSKAARSAGLYLVANLNEKTRCHNRYEIIKSNLVFDRTGSIVSVYRKPVSNIANCTIDTSDLTTFTTDFGVTFALMMEEDLVLKNPEINLKNFVVSGTWVSDIPFLSASQLSPTWSYTKRANLITSHGIYNGEIITDSEPGLITAELLNNGIENITTPPVIAPENINTYPGEDMSRYIIRPLNIEANGKGYKETVCHRNFCCEFNVKIGFEGSRGDVNYSLAVHSGIRHYGGSHYIGTYNCAVFACAGLYKRSCSFRSENNNTNIVFEKLSISANFSSTNTAQYPLVLSHEQLTPDRFCFTTITVANVKQVTVAVSNTSNLLTVAIFGRDFKADYESFTVQSRDGADSIYNYIITEDVVKFFDYVWISMRILIFIIYIYVLEMM